jgi:hypothetical protein
MKKHILDVTTSGLVAPLEDIDVEAFVFQVQYDRGIGLPLFHKNQEILP